MSLPPEFSFRNYRNGDEEDLAELLSQCLVEPYTPDRVIKVFAQDPNFHPPDVLMVEHEKRIIGCLFIVWRKMHIGCRIFIKMGGISGVCTHPSYRRRGIMTFLMKKAHDYIRENGGIISGLFTSEKHYPNASRLYIKLGYVHFLRAESLVRTYSFLQRVGSFISSRIKRLFSFKKIRRGKNGYMYKTGISYGFPHDQELNFTSLYQKCYGNSIGHIGRTMKDFNFRLNRSNVKPIDVICVEENEKLTGYLITKHIGPSILVLEVCIDPESNIRRNISILNNYLVETLSLKKHTISYRFIPQRHWLFNMIERGVKIKDRVFMIKILDAKKIRDHITRLFLQRSHSDGQIYANLKVEITKTHNAIITITGKENQELGNITMPLYVLLRLLVSDLAFEEFLKSGLVKGQIPQRISKVLFPLSSVYISFIDSF